MTGKRSKTVKSTEWKWSPSVSDKVVVESDGEFFIGEVLKILGDKYRINLVEAGGSVNTRLDKLFPMCLTPKCKNPANRTPSPYYCKKCLEASKKYHTDKLEQISKKGGQESKGFSQYGIKWNKGNSFFTLDQAETGIHFYGFYRKAKFKDEFFWSIDLFAVRKNPAKEVDEEFSCDPISYTEDPLLSIRSLNADICAAANRWYYQRIDGSAKTIDDLVLQAKQPTVHINRLATVDALIMKIKEFRDTAIRCGGTRTFEIKGDRPGEIPLLLQMNVSVQAFALEGKVPSLGRAGAFDGLETRKRGERPAQPTKVLPDKANVDALLSQLKLAREADDKAQQRKIRAILRSIGHSGGMRALEQK